MKKIMLIFSLAGTPLLSFADCQFIILNYTGFAVTAKVGFYNKIDKTITVKPVSTTIENIKSEYNCNDSTTAGTGRAYILFPKDPNYAGANYSPVNGINLMGKFSGTNDGRGMQSDNGTPIWLDAPGKAISDKKFEIRLNFTERANSKLSITQ